MMDMIPIPTNSECAWTRYAVTQYAGFSRPAAALAKRSLLFHSSHQRDA